jgi:hypothetical protein
MVFEIPEDIWGDDLTKFLKESEEFAKLFPNKEQKEALIAIFANINFMVHFHAYEDTNPHESTLAKRLFDSDAKLRNHRHQLDKNFSAKAEF